MEVTPDVEEDVIVVPWIIDANGIFRFDKSLLTRQRECSDVLEASKVAVPASKIRAEWGFYIEVKIEPAGWQAFWIIPRVICESFKIDYPTTVFGMVEQVKFGELKATFRVTGVQDDRVHLPDLHEVALIDLLPTQLQENAAINIEATAECVDTLRYFYKNIWMPWDCDDDEQDWCRKHLKSRIEFMFDLQKNINRSLAAHIKKLLREAREIQERREFLELDLDDDEDLDDTKHKSEITDLMRLHLRMASIKNKIDILENPKMRDIYDEMRGTRVENESDPEPDKSKDHTFIVTSSAKIDCHLQQLQMVKSLLADTQNEVNLRPSLQQCLDECLENTHIYLPEGQHEIKFDETIVGIGTLAVVPKPLVAVINLDETAEVEKYVAAKSESTVISSIQDDSRLLTFVGNIVVDGITFDCRKVRTGIQIRGGSILFTNCIFLGDDKSSTKTGLVVSPSARLWLTQCTIRDFAIGIECSRGSVVCLQKTNMVSCGTAIECRSSSFQVTFRDSSISQSKRYGISIVRERTVGEKQAEKSEKTYSDYEELSNEFTICGNCDFADNHLANVVVVDNYKHISWVVDDDDVKDEPYAFADHDQSMNGDDQDDDHVLVSDESDSELSMSVISSD